MAVKSSRRRPPFLSRASKPPVKTKLGVSSRCPYRRPTVNLVRCEALNYTLCRLHDNIVVVARQTVVESRVSDRLSNQNIIKMDYEWHDQVQKIHFTFFNAFDSYNIKYLATKWTTLLWLVQIQCDRPIHNLQRSVFSLIPSFSFLVSLAVSISIILCKNHPP